MSRHSASDLVRPALLAAGAALAALGLAACDNATTPGPGGSTVAPSRTVSVVLTEYRLRPAATRAVAGPVTFEVHNLGRLTHNLAVTVPGAPGNVGATPPIPPGHEMTLVLTLPAGSYMIASTIQSDADLGERGSLRVVP